MSSYRDILKKISEERKRIWLKPPSYVEEIKKRGFSNIMFARTIAYLVSDCLEKLIRSIREGVLTFEYAKKFACWSLKEFAKMFEGHMFLYKDLKPEFKENIPAQLFNEAASAINGLKDSEELLALLEELQRYSRKVYDWIDWAIPWFSLEKELGKYL
ncbi:MAG: hypothetical protein FGF50_06200 [Candidatus Brockarchaeota archaeon]|nr:hypothetical protein [Candidatus Brockarchaeota archaeon]